MPDNSASILPNGSLAMAATKTIISHWSTESNSSDMPRLRPTKMPTTSMTSTNRSNQLKPRLFISQPDVLANRLVSTAVDCQCQMFTADKPVRLRRAHEKQERLSCLDLSDQGTRRLP